jgi:predicted ATPase with chaperone activity
VPLYVDDSGLRIENFRALLDRVDIQIEVPSVKYKELRGPAAIEDSAIADLAGAQSIDAKHLSEAIHYRTLDRSYWA